MERITQAKWFKYLIEVLYLTFLLGLCSGIVLGLIEGWKYASKGFFLPILDTLKFSINESIFIAFLFLLIYLLVFLILHRMIRNNKRACFVSSAILLLPVFLFLAYKINKTYIIGFFELKAIIWNLAIVIGFILLWLLLSGGLFFWIKSRILNTLNVNIRVLSLVLGILLVFNISMFLFHRVHKIDSPSVIILLVDCLRADHLSSYGYSRNTSPNIDKFAKDSVMFTQAISQSTFTKTSIASLFTSRYPYQHGAYGGRQRDTILTSDVLSEEETTLAEILLQNGYLTMAWVKNSVIRSYMGFSQGFAEYKDREGSIENINKNFTEWINIIGRNHKFFAYIHYLDLHDPYQPKPPYDTMYGVYSDVYASNKSIYLYQNQYSFTLYFIISLPARNI